MKVEEGSSKCALSESTKQEPMLPCTGPQRPRKARLSPGELQVPQGHHSLQGSWGHFWDGGRAVLTETRARIESPREGGCPKLCALHKGLRLAVGSHGQSGKRRLNHDEMPPHGKQENWKDPNIKRHNGDRKGTPALGRSQTRTFSCPRSPPPGRTPG